tara:strand:- start:429 stop:1208 length:780 start_codon:yes stop_codon:yes gene_type:complete
VLGLKQSLGIGKKRTAAAAAAASFPNTKSIDFDGTDDFLASASNVQIDGAGTFSWWLKTENLTTSGSHYMMKFGEASANYCVIESGDLTFYWMTFNGAFDVSSSHRADYLDDGEWHHFVFTTSRPGGNGTEAISKIYLDATEIATKTDTRTQSPYTASKFVFGAAHTGGYGAIECQADEMAWWDGVALDADAITAIYNSGTPTDLSEDAGNYDNSGDLTHWWRMGDGDTYPTIEDNEGSIDLTMTNMASGDIETDVPSA